MKVVSLAFVVAITIVCAVCTAAQEQPLSFSQPVRTVGAAEVYYFKEKNKTRAQVRIYAVGEPGITSDMRDSLIMDVIFECDGSRVVTPKAVVIAFSSHSATGPKYQKDRYLHFYTEGIGGFAGITFRTNMLSSSRSSSGGTNEVILSSPIDYQKFLSIVSGQRVAVDLGETHFVLTKEQMKALNDLTKTIEK